MAYPALEVFCTVKLVLERRNLQEHGWVNEVIATDSDHTTVRLRAYSKEPLSVIDAQPLGHDAVRASESYLGGLSIGRMGEPLHLHRHHLDDADWVRGYADGFEETCLDEDDDDETDLATHVIYEKGREAGLAGAEPKVFTAGASRRAAVWYEGYRKGSQERYAEQNRVED